MATDAVASCFHAIGNQGIEYAEWTSHLLKNYWNANTFYVS